MLDAPHFQSLPRADGQAPRLTRNGGVGSRPAGTVSQRLVLLPACRPRARRRATVREVVVAPGSSDRGPVGGEIAVELGGTPELRIDPLQVDPSVDEGALERAL